MNYYLKALKNYATFKGRATRSEYWYYFLFTVIAIIIAATIDNVLGITFKRETPFGTVDSHYGYVYLAYALATLLPGLAVAVRRLHDVGKSGWFYFIVLIPIAGAIWFLVLMCTDSQPGANEYGPNPKGEGSSDGPVGGEALDSHLTT
jgi:uncharacterized membrane protein YhaH (DUF805 family)